jgi:hypothetical protein
MVRVDLPLHRDCCSAMMLGGGHAGKPVHVYVTLSSLASGGSVLIYVPLGLLCVGEISSEQSRLWCRIAVH